MWYLIIPPIVVVASLAFLLWYLSRKGEDPSIARKVSELEGEAKEKISFSRTKGFLLRILEKMTQRFKVGTLQMHNAFNDWSQSIKARRREIQTSVASQEADKSVFSEPEQTEVSEIPKNTVKTSETPQNDFLQTPLVRSKRSESETVRVSMASKEDVPRPMVSETAAHPEVKRKKVVGNAPREESLIKRIASNPKDFTAYEELGDHYFEAGNISDAKECYRQVLKLSPVQRMVKIKIRRLEKFLSEQK